MGIVYGRKQMIILGFFIAGVCALINLAGTAKFHVTGLMRSIIDAISMASYAGIYGPLW
jgi:hypothetical protein